MSGRPYSACTVLTRNCQFAILSPTKKDQEGLGVCGGSGGNFEKGICSMMLKLSGPVHSSLAEILIFNFVCPRLLTLPWQPHNHTQV